MTSVEFKYIIKLKGLNPSSKSVLAAELVLVQEYTQVSAAKELGIKTPSVNRVVRKIVSYKHSLRAYAKLFS
ncbi:hypothetical protein ABT56_22445 [Photobacterium aquae]|uniref:Uncharacterized protein n=1 Tax=Photobacterium aquae TaxID=1195763 RepID=A0A0J1GMA5_9GAMM|nr:hypothetical protein [Photobacterium aquae]KLV00873.1 hypothetical protein ABT56_22445 [Photobacterium aquae]